MDATEQEARIVRMQEETLKFVAEQHKLFAEQSKLFAETMKLQRDHVMAPIALSIAGVGGLAGLFAAIVTVLRATGRL